MLQSWSKNTNCSKIWSTDTGPAFNCCASARAFSPIALNVVIPQGSLLIAAREALEQVRQRDPADSQLRLHGANITSTTTDAASSGDSRSSAAPTSRNGGGGASPPLGGLTSFVWESDLDGDDDGSSSFVFGGSHDYTPPSNVGGVDWSSAAGGGQSWSQSGLDSWFGDKVDVGPVALRQTMKPIQAAQVGAAPSGHPALAQPALVLFLARAGQAVDLRPGRRDGQNRQAAVGPPYLAPRAVHRGCAAPARPQSCAAMPPSPGSWPPARAPYRLLCWSGPPAQPPWSSRHLRRPSRLGPRSSQRPCSCTSSPGRSRWRRHPRQRRRQRQRKSRRRRRPRVRAAVRLLLRMPCLRAFEVGSGCQRHGLVGQDTALLHSIVPLHLLPRPQATGSDVPGRRSGRMDTGTAGRKYGAATRRGLSRWRGMCRAGWSGQTLSRGCAALSRGMQQNGAARGGLCTRPRPSRHAS